MPYGPAAHYNPVPDFGFSTYRAYPGAPFGAGATDPWATAWGGAAPLGAEPGFALEQEPVLMFFDLGGAGAPPPPAPVGLASVLPEVLGAVRLLPEVAAGQRETVESLREVQQRIDALQLQVETLAVRIAGTAPASRTAVE